MHISIGRECVCLEFRSGLIESNFNETVNWEKDYCRFKKLSSQIVLKFINNKKNVQFIRSFLKSSGFSRN